MYRAATVTDIKLQSVAAQHKTTTTTKIEEIVEQQRSQQEQKHSRELLTGHDSRLMLLFRDHESDMIKDSCLQLHGQ